MAAAPNGTIWREQRNSSTRRWSRDRAALQAVQTGAGVSQQRAVVGGKEITERDEDRTKRKK
jgi:hypothetical protein